MMPARPPFRPLRALGRSLALAAALLMPLTAMPAYAQSGVSLLRDTEIEAILHDDAAPLFDAAGLDSKNVEILLIGSKDLQASAGPGQMAIYTGLILESENPNQLNGVIAHEIAHLAGGHSFRSGDMTKAGLKPMLLTMGIGLLAMVAGAPDAGAALLSSSGYFGTLGALGYSREQESRADQAAAGYLEKANQSGKGLVEFFDNFRYQEVFRGDKQFPYFRSHPLSSDRIEALRSRAEKLPHYETKDSEAAVAAHTVMKAKLDGFLNPQLSLAKYKETDKSYPARYARAIAYYQTKDPDRAIKLIDELLVDHPDNPYLYELKGQILFEFARTAEAEAPQRKSVELKPDAPLLRINLGQTLINLPDEKKQDEGIAELKKALLQEEDNNVAWRLLAEAYDKRGDDGLARLATAEGYFSIGAMRESRVFAMRARELFEKNTVEWRRATDIVMASEPSEDDLKQLARDERR
jgi:predicted Zn-dependent protease